MDLPTDTKLIIEREKEQLHELDVEVAKRFMTCFTFNMQKTNAGERTAVAGDDCGIAIKSNMLDIGLELQQRVHKPIQRLPTRSKRLLTNVIYHSLRYLPSETKKIVRREIVIM